MCPSCGVNLEGVSVNPSTDRVYVASEDNGNVSVIDAKTNKVISNIPVGGQPKNVSVNPSNDRVYVANGYGYVSVIDGKTNNVTKIRLGPGYLDVTSVSVNPSTNRVYAGIELGDKNGTLAVIDGKTNAVLPANITVGWVPTSISVNPSTDMVYVANRDSHTISVIDGKTNNVTTIQVHGDPISVSVNPSTNMVYVSNMFAPDDNANVIFIDGKTNTVLPNVYINVFQYANGNCQSIE